MALISVISCCVNRGYHIIFDYQWDCCLQETLLCENFLDGLTVSVK